VFWHRCSIEGWIVSALNLQFTFGVCLKCKYQPSWQGNSGSQDIHLSSPTSKYTLSLAFPLLFFPSSSSPQSSAPASLEALYDFGVFLLHFLCESTVSVFLHDLSSYIPARLAVSPHLLCRSAAGKKTLRPLAIVYHSPLDVNDKLTET